MLQIAQRNFTSMNVERVESMFGGVQEAFISETRKLKNELVKEFDVSEKLKEINQKNELKIGQLDEQNQKLKKDLVIAQSLIEDKQKLIKALDPAGVGQRIIRSLNAEEIENLKKNIDELESKENDLLEINTKLESDKAEHVKTIEELRKEVLAQKDRQASEIDRVKFILLMS